MSVRGNMRETNCVLVPEYSSVLDAEDFYRVYYHGASWQYVKLIDRPLHDALKRAGAGLLKKKPTCEELLRIYDLAFMDLTRGQLARENKALYDLIRVQGLLDHIPLGKRGRKPKTLEQKLRDLEEYAKKHKGLTRGQLARRDPNLYERIRSARMLKYIPTVQDLKGK